MGFCHNIFIDPLKSSDKSSLIIESLLVQSFQVEQRDKRTNDTKTLIVNLMLCEINVIEQVIML